MCDPGRLKVSIVPLTEITGPSTLTACVRCIIPSFYKNYILQVELEIVKSFSGPLVLLSDYHLMCTRFDWPLIQIHSSQGLIEIETPIGDYNHDKGSRGQH